MGSGVPSRVSLLISIPRLNLVLPYLRDSSQFPRRRPLVYLNRCTPSCQSRVYRVTQLRTDGVQCRESAGTGQVNLKVVLGTGTAFSGFTMGRSFVRLSFSTPTIGMQWIYVIQKVLEVVGSPWNKAFAQGGCSHPSYSTSSLRRL